MPQILVLTTTRGRKMGKKLVEVEKIGTYL